MSGEPVRIRAVLFDVGGPINTEVAHERAVDAAISRVLTDHGLDTTDEEYASASAWAVESFAPDAYAAMIWRLTGADAPLARNVYDAFRCDREPEIAFELREGIGQVLAWLRDRGLLLGLAANQPAAMLDVLDAAGVGAYFDHRQVSGTHGYRKPDVRLFLRCCDDLEVRPEECIMVGDRIDNDIAPARLLGMRTVLFRTGRHIAQRPRSWEEVPDAEVHGTAELRAAIERLRSDV